MTTFFPEKHFKTCDRFATAYFEQMAAAVRDTDLSPLNEIAAALKETVDNGNFIFICGNGGSAGIANHSLCDFLKCVRTDTKLLPRIMSLSAHTEMNSALANDISYDDVFSYQIESMGREGDLLWTISSSGNSENVVRAIAAAKAKGMKTVSFTGFSGGRSKEDAHMNAHVPAQNYGVVEDVHMGFIHILTQYLRMDNMDETLIPDRKF
jgi:phosphoheptose isomerase